MKPRRGLLGARGLRFATLLVGVSAEAERRERKRRVAFAAAVVFMLLLIGTAGFRFLAANSYGWLDCLYMTVITISTVGFAETIPVRESESLTAFTIGLILLGGGALLYFISSVAAMVIEGDLLHELWRRRMDRNIARLDNHVVVAGAGRNGVQALRDFAGSGTPFVVIEASTPRIEQLMKEFGEEMPHIVGDALDDTTLVAAGIEKARGLLAVLHEDRDNLYLCLSARHLNPDLRIVAKIDQSDGADKFERVGVDAVVSPAHMGGRRMATEMIRPEVTSFLDAVVSGAHSELSLDEIQVGESSEFAGNTLRDANLSGRFGALIVGMKDSPGAKFRYNPVPDDELPGGGTVIALGRPEAIVRLRKLLA